MAILNNLSIRKKVMVLAIILTAVVITVTAIIFTANRSIKQQSQHMNEVISPVLNKAYQVKIAVIQVQQWLTDVGATRGLDGLNDGPEEAEKNAQDFRRLISELKALDPQRVQAYDEMLVAFEDYYKVGKQMANAYIANGPAGGNPIMANFDAVAEKIASQVDDFLENAKRESDASMALQIKSAGHVRHGVCGGQDRTSAMAERQEGARADADRA